ncbi:hypothetical protein ACFX2B_001802 [Malus domestica]
MVEKRRRTRRLKIAQLFGQRKIQSGEPRLGMMRVGARATSKKNSKNLSTFVTSSDTYPEDERIQGCHGGYDPSTYQRVGNFYFRITYILLIVPEIEFI